MDEVKGMKIIQGDCLEKLKELPDNSVDSVVTDPPYELGFMGKKWDNSGIAYNVDMWRECLRVLKPGGYLLCFGGSRTHHRIMVAIEDAGFEIRDTICWAFGSGFPKSLNIGKVTEKFLKTGNASWNGTGDSSNGALGYSKLQYKQDYRPEDYSNRHQNKDEITEEQAKQWKGWGTALKPAVEYICMARKPLAEKTVVENCLKWGTGGINIDESRVKKEEHDRTEYGVNGIKRKTGNVFGKQYGEHYFDGTQARFPANLIHDNSEEVRECFPDIKSTQSMRGIGLTDKDDKVFGKGDSNFNTLRGHNDSGNASRFFKSIIYVPKASNGERNKGCEELTISDENLQGLDTRGRTLERDDGTLRANNHPTVKPVELMEYLVKMVTPKGGLVLDPFMGSGTTGVACLKNCFQFIGIEKEEEYVKIAEHRLNHLEEEYIFIDEESGQINKGLDKWL